MQQRVHDEGVARVDRLLGVLAGHRGLGFRKHRPMAVGDLRDQVGRDAEAAVGEHRVCRRHLHRRRGARAEAHRQVGGVQLGVEAEACDVILRILRADRLEDPDGHEVLRLGQCHAQAHRAVELAVVVLRLPRFAAGLVGRHEEWRIVDDRRRREALLERSRIDERLERRPGLPEGLGDVVELIAPEIEASDQRQDGAVLRAHRHERGLGGRHLRDGVVALVVAGQPHDGAGPDPLVGGGALRQGALDELEPRAGDDRLVAIGEHGPDFLRRGLQDDRGEDVVAVGVVLEHPVEHRLLFGRIGRKIDVGLGAAISVPLVVVDEAAAHRRVGGLLIGPANRRPDGDAAGIGIVAVGVEDDLPGHLGDVLGVDRHGVAGRLPDIEWRVLCFAPLVVS